MTHLSRRFTIEDQIAFGQLSGDNNPIHVSPLIARRLMFGAPVVHGIHLVLWALSKYSSDKPSRTLTHLDVEFLQAVTVDSEVTLEWFDEDGGCKLNVFSNDDLKAKIWFGWKEGIDDLIEPNNKTPDHDTPLSVDINDIELQQTGVLPIDFKKEKFDLLFPDFYQKLPAAQLAGLIASTRLVGMRCPGLNSIYSSLSLEYDRGCEKPNLSYSISDIDLRFSKIDLSLTCSGWKGVATAFFRPPPTVQKKYSEMADFVAENEFSGVRALVIGGSRGLGEVASKLLAAGGSDVVLSFYKGADDANNVVDEITRSGGRAKAMQIDVTSLKIPQLPEVDLLVYMSSPFIFSAQKGVFSSSLFLEFCAHYIEGFEKICSSVIKNGTSRVLYPSSVAVEVMTRNMGEYSAAKAAAEILCRQLEMNNKGLKIHTPRFDRLPTDQTSTLMPMKTADPIPVILAALRETVRGLKKC